MSHLINNKTETCIEPELPAKDSRCLLCNDKLLFYSKNNICLICGIKIAKFVYDTGKNDAKNKDSFC